MQKKWLCNYKYDCKKCMYILYVEYTFVSYGMS